MFPKILIVDDSSSDRLIISKMLSGYDVLIANDGLEAMRLMDEQADIDLLILDLNMPRMDGFQVLKAMKAAGRHKRPRVIILTNYDELENEKLGLQLGAVDYITKPVHMDSLNARIKVHVELLRVQRALEHDLYEQGLTFDMIFSQAPIGIAITFGRDTLAAGNEDIYRINPMYEQITGRTQEELLKLGWEAITHPDDLKEEVRNNKKLLAGEIDTYAMEKRYIRPDGSAVWVYIIVAYLELADGLRHNNICLVQDISQRKTVQAELVESERAKSVLLSNLPGLAYRCRYDSEWTMEFVSRRCLELTGYLPESLIGNKVLSFNDIIAPEYREKLRDEWEAVLAKKQPFKYEYEIVTAGRDRKWVLEMGEGIFNDQGLVETLEGIIIDITDRKTIEDSLKYNNEHDRWTGLLNRGSLENLLSADLKARTDGKRALISINLSLIQSLTTTYGFHYAQDLIRKAADSLRRYCSEKCLLFYTYEDRFAFYLKDYRDNEGLMGFCTNVLGTLETLLISERIGSGIGVVVIEPDDAVDTDQLLKKALIASEKAIEIFDRDFGICIYDKELEAQVLREEDIMRELAQIAQDACDGGLFMQYQPILDLKSNGICGFEALARMRSAAYGLIPPLEFIPIAEKTKLILPIGQKIIRQALAFLKNLNDKGYGAVNISINISAIQLIREDFARNLFEMISSVGVVPANISLEVTESVFSSNYQEMNRILGELKRAGIQIAVDDFGTGYSSLARQKELNVNILKIDRSFINALMHVQPQDAITSDIISIAHKLGHFVTAEGVEHEQQKQYLLGCGCDRIQGYLISRPLDEEKAIAFLEKHTGGGHNCHERHAH